MVAASREKPVPFPGWHLKLLACRSGLSKGILGLEWLWGCGVPGEEVPAATPPTLGSHHPRLVFTKAI